MFGDCAGAISACFGTVGILLSLLASFWCQSIKFTPIRDGSNITFEDTDIHISPWFQQTTQVGTGSINGEYFIWTENYCINFWAEPELDSYWKASRAFSVIAIVIGGLGTIALYFSCCFPQHFNMDLWRSLALKFCVPVTISQGLTLLIFKSTACTDNNIIRAMEQAVGGINVYNNTCEWDKGSSMNVAAIVCWFAAGLSMILIGPPPPAGAAPRPRRSKKKPAESSAPAADAEKEKDDAENGGPTQAVTE